MKWLVCSIFDKVSQEYAPLWQSHNRQTACRDFLASMPKDVDEDDYQLTELMIFENKDGKVVFKECFAKLTPDQARKILSELKEEPEKEEGEKGETI